MPSCSRKQDALSRLQQTYDDAYQGKHAQQASTTTILDLSSRRIHRSTRNFSHTTSYAGECLSPQKNKFIGAISTRIHRLVENIHEITSLGSIFDEQLTTVNNTLLSKSFTNLFRTIVPRLQQAGGNVQQSSCQRQKYSLSAAASLSVASACQCRKADSQRNSAGKPFPAAWSMANDEESSESKFERPELKAHLRGQFENWTD
ncbi:hypothetical protein NPIL_437711 [Nephila pilipes]|uniref:Uncharacterized protein n=1 Tax=Nephila pilipes TaxID=299642 RepID=A0A8X6NXW3_NEPPI|nr:hypothetical protein NPIL_437711 [Nephila pilipes]